MLVANIVTITLVVRLKGNSSVFHLKLDQYKNSWSSQGVCNVFSPFRLNFAMQEPHVS